VNQFQSRIATTKELSCDKIYTPYAQLTDITGYSGINYISIGDATHRVDVLKDLTVAGNVSITGNITNSVYNALQTTVSTATTNITA
jgi:hypothetical protein